jgi:hypothetical protein
MLFLFNFNVQEENELIIANNIQLILAVFVI